MVLLKASSAVTVRLNGVPAVAVAGALTAKCGPAVEADTPIVPLELDIDDVTVSVAVIVWLPAVARVAEKVPTPLVSVTLAGSTAAASVLVKCTVPA